MKCVGHCRHGQCCCSEQAPGDIGKQEQGVHVRPSGQYCSEADEREAEVVFTPRKIPAPDDLEVEIQIPYLFSEQYTISHHFYDTGLLQLRNVGLLKGVVDAPTLRGGYLLEGEAPDVEAVEVIGRSDCVTKHE